MLLKPALSFTIESFGMEIRPDMYEDLNTSIVILKVFMRKDTEGLD